MNDSDQGRKPGDDGLGLERLVFFSDAVMAIAITLLAIDIRVPELPAAAGNSELSARLSSLSPQITSFVISFTVIGIYWASHHRYFALIRRPDRRLIALNLVFLFFVAAMPFSSSLLGHYPDLAAGVIPYAGNVAALGLSMAAIWWYASAEHRLVQPDLDRATVRMFRIRPLGTAAIFLTSIPIAFWSPRLGTWFWLLSPLLIALMPRLMRLFGSRPPDG